MTDVTIELPNPISREFWTRPADVIEHDLADLIERGPTFHADEPSQQPDMIPTGPGGWAIMRHADILEISKHPEIFSSANGITALDAPPEFNEFFSSMIAMDDPRHGRLRKLVSKGFTPRMLNALSDGIVTQADSILDEVCERGSCDFVVDVAARLPLQIVCDLMDIPASHYQDVFDNTNVILGAGDPEYVPDQGDILTAILTAGGNLAAIMTEVAESKKGSDGTDLTSILVNADIDGEKLTFAEIASFFVLLVVAGNETTRNSISWALRYLTANPDQRAIWAGDVEAVSTTAVEEVVRMASPVTYMRRTVTADTEVGGVPMAAGDKVLMFYLAANRDPSVFDDPLRFDVLRNPNPHVGFGGPGPHFCLGAHLARRQISTMYERLFTRLPDIVAVGEPDLLASSFIHGVKHQQAEFTPTAPLG